MTHGITNHALERAVERYGFEPTAVEVSQILADCHTGKAPCLRKNELGHQHVALVRGKLMIVCLHQDMTRIVTVLPRTFFNSGSKIEHHQKAYGAKQVAKTSPIAVNPTYSRAAWKREGAKLAKEME